MAGKIIFFAGLLGIGGYVGYTIKNHDPAVFPLSKDQIQASLVKAETVLPRKDGDGHIKIWGAGRSAQGVKLNMRYDVDAPLLACKAVIEEIASDQSRVSADCGEKEIKNSAIARTETAIHTPMFEEHIMSILHKREFNRDNVDSKQIGIVMRDMGPMQREALKAHDEMQRMENEQ